jgi:hypothetical protein
MAILIDWSTMLPDSWIRLDEPESPGGNRILVCIRRWVAGVETDHRDSMPNVP